MSTDLVIIGCGSTGQATAAFLTLSGYKITLCDTEHFSNRFASIQENHGILLRGDSGKTGLAMPELLTTDFQEALSSSHRVLICVDAGRQRAIAEQCADYVSRQHCILISPGNMGAMIFKQVFQQKGKDSDILLGELSGNLWSCRKTGKAEVLIAGRFSEKKAAGFPASTTDKLVEAFRPLLKLTAGKNIIETTLNSPNVVTHVAGSVLNASQIEKSGGSFAFFAHGLSKAVNLCTEQVEQERNQILQALGLDIYQNVTALNWTLLNEPEKPELALFRSLDGPENLKHRYISEDASCGMALMISIAHKLGIPVPMSEAVVNLAGCFNQVDYYGTGRTLENLKLNGDTPEELVKEL